MKCNFLCGVMLLLGFHTLWAADIKVSGETGVFCIAQSGQEAVPVVYDEVDHQVVSLAATMLADDIMAVTGQRPQVSCHLTAGTLPVIAGTLGQSALIDRMAAEGKIAASEVSGRWEAFGLQIVNRPTSDIRQALVIFGSQPRSTAYGLLYLSRLMGVSPFVWWADVHPRQQETVWLSGDKTIDEGPDVKYRGIFINDEDWGIEPWSKRNLDDMGPQTYERVFQLLLRLRANTLWPAMHDCTRAYWTVSGNSEMAARYDIVMGSSHCEPMLRNNVYEWPRFSYQGITGTTGKNTNFNYATNADMVRQYWSERVDEAKGQNVMYTIGMRGVHDEAIQGYSGAQNIKNGLTQIFKTQRDLLKDAYGTANAAAQLFVPYKEVLAAYNAGLEVPEDVTLCWVDDNHGYIRQMPTSTEQARGGGNGIYYHLSYWGQPMDYLWLSSISPSLISYELSRAYDQGVRTFWMINVGDIKPAEKELQFVMDMAWDTDRWSPLHAGGYMACWAENTFGSAVAADVAEIMESYYRLAANGKPEHVSEVTYSDGEMDARIAEYATIYNKLQTVKSSIVENQQDAFFELVEYPVACAYLHNLKIFRARQSFTYAYAGKREKALRYSQEAIDAHWQIQSLTAKYNGVIADGKWNGFMNCQPRVEWKTQFAVPTVATESDVAATESELNETETCVVEAADYTNSSGGLTTVSGLGLHRVALTVWPMDTKAYTVQDLSSAPWVEYQLPVRKGTNKIAVRCLPTFPLNGSYYARFAVIVDDGKPEVKYIGSAVDTDEWKANVLRGHTVNRVEVASDEEKTVTVRIALMDPGIALCDVMTEFPRVYNTEMPDTTGYYYMSQVLGGVKKYINLTWKAQSDNSDEKAAKVSRHPFAVKFERTGDYYRIVNVLDGRYIGCGTGTTYASTNADYSKMTVTPVGGGNVFAIHPDKANRGQWLNVWDANSTVVKAGSTNYQWVIEKADDDTHPAGTVHIGESKWTTFVAPFEVLLQNDLAGVRAYKAIVANNDTVELEELSGCIPANTPVLLYSDTPVDTEVCGLAFSDNTGVASCGLLVGNYNESYRIAAGNYVLQSDEGVVGFYRLDTPVDGTSGHAYISGSMVPDGARCLRIIQEQTTKVDGITSDGRRASAVYSVSGQRMSGMRRGLNIVKTPDGRVHKIIK